MRPSPLLSAAAAAALIAAVAGPASAATAAKPAQGLATSGVTLLGLAAGGHTLSTGTLALLSDTLTTSPLAQVVLTPLTVDGTAYGRQVVGPSSGPTSSPVVDSTSVAPSLLSGLLAVRAPVLTAAASNPDGGASTEAGSSSLGGASLLGLPLTLDGALDVTSVVTKAGSVGQQTVSVEDLALPSIADLLGALGLDVTKLPTDVLVELLGELDLLTTTVSTANQALDQAQAAIQTQTDAVTAEVTNQLAAVDVATAQLTAENAALTALESVVFNPATAQAAAQAQLVEAQATAAARAAAATLASTTYTTLKTAYDALPLPILQAPLKPALDAAKAVLDEATALLAEATAAVDAATAAIAAANDLEAVRAAVLATATSAVALAQSALDAANRLLDAAQAALAGVVAGLQPLISQLIASVVAVLDGTPLVSLDALTVVSRATATSAEPGDQSATVTGGEVAGLRVLGTDVLSNVLGTTRVDLLDMTTTQLGAVNALVSQLTGVLSSVLSTVPGFPTLSVPAPDVELLTKAVRTGNLDGFGTASTDLRALAITLPSISVPSALALPGAASLPALGGITQVTGLLTSAPITLELANLGNAVRFSPAVAAAGTPTTGTPTTGTPTTGTPTTGTPTTGVPTAVGTPQLPRTGADQALAALGLALLTGAFVVRRRRTLGEV